MASFCFLDKNEKEMWLPNFFDLFYENMQKIAPSESTYDEERERWISTVSEALEKEPRRIIVCSVNGEFAGFLMYYVRKNLLMVEELQIKKKYQMPLLFYQLCKYLGEKLPKEIEYIEAYAHKQNVNSQGIMNVLGMEKIDDSRYPHLIHLRGSFQKAKKRFR